MADGGAKVAPASGRRRHVVLGLVVGLVVAAWTATWFYVRGQVETAIDAELERQREAGLDLDCSDRSIGGYPFRIEVRCSALAVSEANAGVRAAFAGARAVALLYSPSHVIVELDGPGSAAGPRGETLAGTWTLLQASLRFANGRLERASLAADGLDGRFARAAESPVAVKAAHAEFHLRPDGDVFGFDVAAGVKAGSLTVDGRALGPTAVDLAADATVLRLPAVGGAGFLPAFAANDGRVEIRSFKVETGRLSIEGQGNAGLETSGNLSGSFRLVAAGLDAIASGGAITPDAAMVASGFLIFGKPVDKGPPGGRSLDFTIDQGRMKLGNTNLGRLPPLFRPVPAF